MSTLDPDGRESAIPQRAFPRRRRVLWAALAVLLVGLGSAALANRRHPAVAVHSPFTTPIAVDAQADPRSPLMIRALVAGARDGFRISAGAWTTPLYYASRATPRTTVVFTAGWAPARKIVGVPIPPRARPDPAGDHHLTVLDRHTGCEYDFWQAKRNADGTWSASWGNATSAAGGGVYKGGWGPTAAGFTNVAGKIRPGELKGGEIRHALVFGFPYTKAGGPVPPATASDGRSRRPGAIPEGARLQLDPRLDLRALRLNRWQSVIARALQVYGMYLGDTGDTVGLSAINRRSFHGTPYPWGNSDYALLPVSLLSHMRVLRLPPQYHPRGKLVRTACAKLR